MSVDPVAPNPAPATTEVIETLPAIISETRTGWKTTEFWLAILTAVLIQVNAIPLPEKFEGWATTLLAVAYAVSRGLAKQGVPDVEEPKQLTS